MSKTLAVGPTMHTVKNKQKLINSEENVFQLVNSVFVKFNRGNGTQVKKEKRASLDLLTQHLPPDTKP